MAKQFIILTPSQARQIASGDYSIILKHPSEEGLKPDTSDMCFKLPPDEKFEHCENSVIELWFLNKTE